MCVRKRRHLDSNCMTVYLVLLVLHCAGDGASPPPRLDGRARRGGPIHPASISSGQCKRVCVILWAQLTSTVVVVVVQASERRQIKRRKDDERADISTPPVYGPRKGPDISIVGVQIKHTVQAAKATVHVLTSHARLSTTMALRTQKLQRCREVST